MKGCSSEVSDCWYVRHADVMRLTVTPACMTACHHLAEVDTGYRRHAVRCRVMIYRMNGTTHELSRNILRV